MVEKLSVQIALEGSEEVQSQMYKIGAAGRQAFLGIAEAAATLSAVLAAELALGSVVATKKLLTLPTPPRRPKKR